MTPAELLDNLLALRGYETPESRERFLQPNYDGMHDPFLMHDMDRAVARIFDAIAHNEKICVYSDYDADGIPGAVILHDFFKKIGYSNFCNYIPHRHDEGYGVHREALKNLADEGAKLVITVDVGITACDEIEYGNSLGLEIIVTDHHEPIEEVEKLEGEKVERKLKLPDAFAIVNPKLGNYPDRMLCGAGVAFKLVQAIGIRLKAKAEQEETLLKPYALSLEPVGWEKWLLDMAGLATLSDMVPLVNENRIIAFYGMKVLQKNQRPGLRALFEKSGISLDHLTETDIVFSITPKLNAASRMAHPVDAFNALATTDRIKALSAAEHLSKLNDERKKIVARIMKDVHKRVCARRDGGDLKKILVIGDPSWPAGILGLVASKVIEEYGVTTFVWGAEGESIKGSVRGVGDVAVVVLMQEVTHLLTQFGGHEDAGGFSTTREHVHFLEENLCNAYEKVKKQDTDTKIPTEENYDIELNLSDITMNHYHAMRQMAPFGMANNKPKFLFKNVTVVSCRQFGKTTEHLEVVVSSNGVKTKAISWYATADSFTEKIEEGKTVNLIAEMDYSVFRGRGELRLMIVDIVH